MRDERKEMSDERLDIRDQRLEIRDLPWGFKNIVAGEQSIKKQSDPGRTRQVYSKEG